MKRSCTQRLLLQNRKEAAKRGVEAGVDIDMMGGVYCENLAQLVKEGSVPEEMVDETLLSDSGTEK